MSGLIWVKTVCKDHQLTTRQREKCPQKIPPTSFSFSSISLVLYFFCTSLISLKAVLRLDEGGYNSPGSFVLLLRYVLKNTCDKKITQLFAYEYRLLITCKQFGPRSGPAKCQPRSGPKLIDTLMVFLKEFFEKVEFKKYLADNKKACKFTQ